MPTLYTFDTHFLKQLPLFSIGAPPTCVLNQLISCCFSDLYSVTSVDKQLRNGRTGLIILFVYLSFILVFLATPMRSWVAPKL